MTLFSDPQELARAAFAAHLAGDSRTLREITHPEAARQYHGNAVTYLAGWLRLEQIRRAVDSGELTPETVSSFRYDEHLPVDDCPLFHLPGVRHFRDITRSDPGDFLERAFAAGAEVFGYPSRPEDPWQRIVRFEFRGAVTREGDVARVPYVHTENEPDGTESSRDGELFAKIFDGHWRLWFDRELFTPLPIFLHE